MVRVASFAVRRGHGLISARRLQTIRLADIVLDRPPFICTLSGPAQGFVDSVAAVGLINPPVVRGRDVVCGYRRLLAARTLGWDRVTTWWVAEQELTPDAAVELAVRDNLAHRGLSEAEKARAVAILIRKLGASPERVRSHFLPLLGRAPHPRALKMYLTVGSSALPVLYLLDEGRIGVGTAYTLASLSESDQRALCHLLSSVASGVNTGREIVEGFVDLALREEREIQSVLSDGWVVASVGPHDSGAAARRLVRELRLRRQPGYHRSRNAEVSSAAVWSERAGARLEVPPGREGGPWFCTIRFRTPAELRQKLTQLTDHRRFEELKRLMGAEG